MATAQAKQLQPGLFRGILAKYTDAKVEQFRRRILAKTVRDLERLSDDRLKDIGVDRAEINRRAYQSVYRNAPNRQSR